jgi:chorismate mutase
MEERGIAGRPTVCRGVRGAVAVPETADGLASATAELLEAMVDANGCLLEDIAAAIFTVPDELAGANPAAAARANGWSSVPLLVVREHGGDDRVPRCLRALLLWNTTKSQAEIRHAYLGRASILRPDLRSEPESETRVP